MTLTDITAQVRTLLQDSQYDAAVIKQAANWFVYELFNNNRTRLMEDSVELTAASGDTTLAFPDNSLAWIEIYATVPSVFDMGKLYTEYPTFMQSYANFATATASTAGKWTMFGNGMRFAQPLSADHTFQFDFIREPVEMEQLSSECEVPNRYAELVARGTKARILEIEEDYDYASQERELLEPLVTAFIKNEARGGGKTRPTVIRTNRLHRNSTGVPRLGE